MKTLLKLFDTTLLNSSERHLYYFDFRHSLKFLDTMQTQFPKNLGAFRINRFLPKLLERYNMLPPRLDISYQHGVDAGQYMLGLRRYM